MCVRTFSEGLQGSVVNSSQMLAEMLCARLLLLFFFSNSRFSDFLQWMVILSRVTSLQVVRKMLSLAGSHFMEVESPLTAWQRTGCNHARVHRAIVSLRHF